MNFCPNTNLPESKALIKQLGLLGFYKHWIQNNYNINEDIADSTKSVSDLLFINKDKFRAKQQEDTVQSLIFQIQKYRKKGLKNTNEILGKIKADLIEGEYEWRNLYGEDEGAIQIADNLKDVLDHFDEFIVKTTRELAKSGITISGKQVVVEDKSIQEDNTIQESSYDSADGIYQKLNYSDDSNFSQSSKDTASGDIKVALSVIPKYVYADGKLVIDEDGEPETELNHLYLPKFEDQGTIWNDLLYTLLDVPIGQKLEYLKNSTNPRHQVIYNEITSNPKTNIQNEFEVVFSKQQAKFTTINISKPDNSDNKTIGVFDTNRSNANSFLVDNWYESFLQSGIVSRDSEGNQYIDTTIAKQAKEAFNNAKELAKTDTPKAIKQIVDILNNLGITISEKAFKESVRDENGKNITGTQVILSKLPYFFNRLSGNITEQDLEDTLEYNNPFINDTSSITLLAKLENKANPTLFETSFISGDGKSKYSFVNNSYLSLKMRKLKSDDNYLQELRKTPYASKSFWLNQLITNPLFKSVFDVQYVDTLGNDKTNQTNKPFRRMSTKEKEFTRIAMFQNQGRGTEATTSNIGQFIGLIPSDKTTIPLFKSLKVPVTGNYKIGFGQDTIKVIYDQITSEYNRIKQTQEQTGDPNIQQVAGYHGKNGAGSKFVVFRFLNEILLDKNQQLILVDDIALVKEVRPAVEKFLTELVTEQIQYWKNNSLYNEDIFDKSYKAKKGITSANLDQSLEQFAGDYAINQFVFMMNQTQLISGDPALHGKNDKGTDGKVGPTNIDKTWINFYKRMAKDIAPGLDGNFKNSSYNTIFLQDLNYASERLNEYRELVDSKIADSYGYNKEGKGVINPADAQEYTTLQEHLDVMDAYGRLTEESKEAGQRLLNGGTDISDINLILQPMKPVYVNDKIEDNIDKFYYIKTSSFPLIPALTSGLEIDKLRLAMEANNIQRAVYESGVKLGLQGEISEISKDGFIKFRELDINSKQIINLDRSGFRIQQELPYHGDQSHQSEGSQARKLILNNVEDTDIINYNGKDITGKEAKKIFESLHIEKMNRAFDKFQDDIGFDKILGRITDLSKIEKILKEEATLRNYPINDIYSIQVIEENGVKRFKVPLGFTNNSSRFESILNALVTNRVIKQELPGFSKVQGSGAGFTKIAGFDEANAVVKSGIIWTSPDTTLTYTRDVDGRLTGADILVPSWFKGTDMSQYIKEDGTLDTDKMPEDLLTLVGIRIPTQGYNSMMKFRVKGFLPNYMGDLAIVPSEIVVQMGSDFDVDKLFLYRYHYTKNDNGTFSRLPLDTSDLSKLSNEQLEDGIMQMFVDRLSDVSLLDQMLEPNGFGTLPEVVKNVAKLQKGDKAIHTFTTKDQNNIHKLNNDGKAGTGIFSLFSTFNKTAQDAKLSLKQPLKFKNKYGQIVEVGNFYEIIGIDGQLKSSVIAYLQSAAVDNAKEQLLGILNINDITMGVAGTMAMLGLDEKFIGYFLAQPVLIDYVNRIQQANDIITGEFDASLESKTREAIYRDLLGEQYSLQLVNDISSKLVLGSKELLQFLEQGNDEGLTQLSAEELETIGKANNMFAVKVLTDFLQIKDVADNIRVLQSATNVDTNGLGASFTSLEIKSTQIDNLLIASGKDSYPINNVPYIFTAGFGITKNIIGNSSRVLKETKAIYSQILPQGSVAYQDVIDKVQKAVGLVLTDNNLTDIYRNIKSYILSSPDIIENIEQVREDLLKSKNNLAKRWEDYSKTKEGKKNILTSRIKPRFAKNKGDNNLLTALNTPASNNSIDINNAMMYFYDMIENGTELEKQLANDLVKYYIVTGAQFGPTSIGKYISYDILEKNNFSEKLRRIEDTMSQGFVLDGFIDQYFQNNPTKAKSFSLENPKSTFVTMEIPELTIESTGILAGYFNVYDQKAAKFLLYKKGEKTPSGFEYTQIPILANTKESIKNYNMVNTSSSAQTEEQYTTGNYQTIETRQEADITDVIKTKYNFNGGAQNILKAIVEKSNNAYYRKMASDYLAKFNNLGNINVLASNSLPSNGWYGSNTISINFSTITENFGEQSDDKFEEVFLHEINHAGTVNQLDKFNRLKATKSNAQMVADGDFTKEQILAINGINNLFNEYSKAYPDQEKLSEYKRVYIKRNGDNNNLTTEELNFLIVNKPDLYPLVDIKEFIAAGLTSETYINKLKQGGFWSKFIEYIGNLLGVNKTDLDALYNSTISLLDTGTNNEVNEDFDITKDEVNRLTFVEQRNEFLRAYKKQIGSIVTQETLDNIKKYADVNDKYSNLRIWGYPTTGGKFELRVSRKDPEVNEDIADAPVKTEQEIFIDRVINKFRDNLKTLQDRQRQLGTNAPAELSVRIDKLINKIADLTERKDINTVITASENKLKEIKKSLSKNTYTPDDLYEYTSYLNMLLTLNQQIEFDEEFSDYTTRLNTIAGEASTLKNRLREAEIKTIQGWINQDLDIPFDLKQKLEQGLKDVGTAESGFLDFSQSTSEVIQSIGNLIERAKFEANQKHDEFAEEFTPLLKEYLSKYKNYDMLLQKDKDGKPNGFLLNKYSDEYYKKAKGNFKFYRANVSKTISDENMKQWETDKKMAYDSMSEEDYFNFLRLNSPIEYLKDWKAGKKSDRTLENNSYKYITEKIDDKWIDPNYAKLKALGEEDPAVKFYNFIEGIIRKNSRKYGQQSNYIPEIQKSTLDYFTSGNMKGGFSNIKEELFNAMTVELNAGNNEIDEVTGEIRPSIPVTMFGNKLSAQDKSYDLARIVEAVQYQEYTLTSKREIEPLLNIYYNILKDSKSIITKPSGDEVIIEKAPSKILDQSNYLIQSWLYNKSKEVEGVSDKKINGRNIAASKVTDSLINYVRIKGMAFNPFSAIGNIMQGLTSNFITGVGGDYFNTSDNFKAFGTMLHSIAGRSDEAKKISKMIRKFDAFSKANELQFGTSRDIKDTQNALNNLSWFELQERGEYFIQGQTLLAMMYHYKVKVGDKTISLYEGYDSNGKWKSEYGEDPLKDKTAMYKFQQRVKAAVIDVHGNYVREIQNKKNFYWRAAMIFRTWLPQAINTRFGSETTDLLTGKTKKGRYRSYNSFVRDEDGKINLTAIYDNILVLFNKESLGNMTEVDKINMRKNIAELALIAAITIMILGLKAALEDLDDEEKNYTTYILNSLSRTQSDLTFFMLPSSFETIIKDPIPLMGVLKDTLDLTTAGFKTITGDPSYKTGPRKGKSRLWKETLDNFPVITQLDKNLTYMSTVFEKK